MIGNLCEKNGFQKQRKKKKKKTCFSVRKGNKDNLAHLYLKCSWNRIIFILNKMVKNYFMVQIKFYCI
jgi:hypothetical protein